MKCLIINPFWDLKLADNGSLSVDLRNECDWGNIQPCEPGDCEDWKDSIGWGNSSDGHIKIVEVINPNSNKPVDNIIEWYNNIVYPFMELFV